MMDTSKTKTLLNDGHHSKTFVLLNVECKTKTLLDDGHLVKQKHY